MNARRAVVTEVVLISAWLGAALFFAVSVAPAVFAALPSRALAGIVVARTLPAVFVTGIALGVVVSAIEIGSVRGRMSPGARSGLVILSACGAAEFVVGPRIAALRAQLGSRLDVLAPDDPYRVAFGRLHAMSVAGLGVAILASVVGLCAALRALRQRS